MKPVPHVKDFMNRKIVILDPETPMGEVAKLLLKKKVQGGAVVDGEGRFLGTVSAQGVMNALLDFAHDEAPPGPAKGYLDPESPTITEETSLLAAAEIFVRRGPELWAIPVMRDDRIVGAVNRLGVIGAVMEYVAGIEDRKAQTLYISALKEIDEKPPW